MICIICNRPMSRFEDHNQCSCCGMIHHDQTSHECKLDKWDTSKCQYEFHQTSPFLTRKYLKEYC